jgi:hypothetical protein
MEDLERERQAWERLPAFLGYTLSHIGSDRARTHVATMRRPDSSLAQFKLDERDLRQLVEALPPARASDEK